MSGALWDALGSGGGDRSYFARLPETLWGSLWLWDSLAEVLISYGLISYSLGKGVLT